MCNCGKSRSRPQPQPAPKPADTSADKNTGKTQQFALERGGKVQEFGSRLEAEAARVRFGGTIRPR